MKSLLAALVAATALAGSVSAQTIEFVSIDWQKAVDQKNATGTVNAGATPYTFRANVSGANASPLTGSTFTGVTLGLTTGSVGPTLTFDSYDKEWQFQSTGYADQASLLVAYPSSGSFAYAMNLTGAAATNATGSSSVAFPAIPNLTTNILQAPLVTISNGAWQPNGTFRITDVNAVTTLTFNAMYASAPGTNDAFHYDVWIDNGVNLTGTKDGFINYDPTTSSVAGASIPSITIAAGQFVDGNTYNLEVGYNQIMASSPILSNSAFVAALVGVGSKISIVTPLAAVPEPAAAALELGAVALLAAWGVRRRR